MTFGMLTLIVLAGLGGPLFGGPTRFPAPLVVGEIVAGMAIGTSGMHWLDPTEPTVDFLAQIGFAMLMLAAGMHVPIKTPNLSQRLPRAALAVGTAAVLAIPLAIAISVATGGSHAAVYAVLLSGGSAAVVLPSLHEAGLLTRPASLPIVLQIALADLLAIIAVPIVLQPTHALHIALGSLAVGASAAIVYAGARAMDRSRTVATLRQLSGVRGWALDLRAALVVLFTLCWIAVRSETSILIAGLSAGLVVSALGGPQRLSTQVIGIAQGFFVPLFFVVLGARIDLSALSERPSLLLLIILLVGANVVTHLATAWLIRRPVAEGLLATAQLGLPAAVAALGLETGTLDPGRAAAVVAAGLCSLPLAALGTRLLQRRSRHPHQQRMPGLGPQIQ
jgi:Kef-type K+ transport system membrane component KefB